MKTEREVRKQIAKVTSENVHVLDCHLATVQVNAPRALMQLSIITSLDWLYWVLGEERPRFKCDDWDKENH